jgi:predicted hotdog family 3-hydroxylacyl-ACP dehydratase
MYELRDLLPHKEPMILISRVTGHNIEARSLTAEVDITPKTMFFDASKKQVPVWVGIEYMAQSIGALSGLYQQQQNSGPAKIGFIIGSKNYQCFTPGFKEGATLTIKVEQLFSDSELSSFDCKIMHLSTILSQTELNVFQPLSVDNFITNHLNT